MIRHKIYILILLVSLLFTYLAITNPENTRIVLILVPFFLTGAILYILLDVIADAIGLSGSVSRIRKKRIYQLLIAFIAVNSLVLGSIGQIRFQDIVIMVAITVIGGLYIAKFSFK